MSEFDKWAEKKYPNASRKDSLGAFSRDLMKSAREGWDAHAELSALKAGKGEAVEVVAWRSERYICGESHYSPPRLTFEQPYSTDRNCEPLMTVAQHKRIVAAITAPPAPADAVSIAPGLERAIQIVREVAQTQPGYSDEREAIFEALSEAYVEAMAPPCTSAAVMSVPIGLLRNICSMVPEKMKPARKELRALLAQSESEG